MDTPDHARSVVAEFIGTALLLTAIVGSGIMSDRLAGGNVALALLTNTIATGAALVALIVTFGPVSGAHFNPLVTLVTFSRAPRFAAKTVSFIGAQITGAVAGVVLAHGMFGTPVIAWSTHVRSGLPQALSEAVATFGLVGVIVAGSRRNPTMVPFVVAAYITSAYWFTASTSFANPAVTLARALTDTFAGIRPGDVPGFIAGQAIGATAAALLFEWLVPNTVRRTEGST